MSDIWNEFEKLAVTQGLVSVAEEGEREQEDASKMPARYDSVSDDAIRLLYGLEPESIYEKGKTIIEVAHPETAIINRTYDAMNAVVENLHQRQDIMAHIALKMPSGHLTQHRYVAAKGDLVKSITRAAFTLDHKDEDELMSLADSCAERLVKGADIKKKYSLEKEAIAPLVVGGVAAGAALLGAAYYFMYGATSAQNVYANSNMVLEELEDLAQKPYTDAIRKDVSNIKQMAENVYKAKSSLMNIKSVDDVAGYTTNDQNKAKEVYSKMSAYVGQLTKVESAIPGWVAAIKADSSVNKDESSDFWAKFKGIQEYLPDFMRNDSEQLIEKLWGKSDLLGGGRSGGLLGSISQEKEIIGQLMQRAQAQMQQKVEEIQKEQQVKPSDPLVPAPEPASQQVASISQQSNFKTQTPQFSTQIPKSEADWVISNQNSAFVTAPAPAGPANVRPVGFAGLPSWE